MQNITLIGMPGCGKSTLGLILAHQIRYHFIDTDEVILDTYHKPLMQLIEENGVEGFISLEESILCSLHTHKAVIATGGSAVYGEKAMDYLHREGKIIYLHHNIDELIDRIGNPVTRGVVRRGDCRTLRDLYAQRKPLYERYADLEIDMTGLPVEACSTLLLDKVREHGYAGTC